MARKSHFTKEERLKIGKEIFEHKYTYNGAAAHYGVSLPTVINYVREYRASIGLIRNTPSIQEQRAFASNNLELDYLTNLSKEELIDEVIKAKVGEARAKKGYKVKGGGQNKEFVTLSNKNTK